MQLLRRVHRWIGLAVATPLVLVTLSGGLLLLRDPYYRARYPEVRREITAADIERQPAILTGIEGQFGRDGIRLVRFPRAGVNAFQVYLTDGSQAFVDSHDGSVLDRWDWSTSVPAFLFELHAHLLMGAAGEVWNGYIALVLVFLALSGVVVWFPRRRSAFRVRHAVPVHTGHGALLRSHAASGVLLVLVVLPFALTGAALVFYEPTAAVVTRLVDGAAPPGPSAFVTRRPSSRHEWSAILATVRSTPADAGPTMYYPPRGDNAVLTFRKRLPGEWHPNGRSYVLIDPYTARAVEAIDARSQGAGSRAMHAVYPIHAATIGGIGTRVVAALAAAGCVWLCVTAVGAYLGRFVSAARRRRDSNRQARLETMIESRVAEASAAGAGDRSPVR